MRRLAPLAVSEAQRTQLERWSRGGATPYRLVIRARIILLASRGRTNREIGRALGTNPITIARWRSRFALLGLEGIRTEAPRSGSPPPVPDEVVQRIIEKTLSERPHGRAHWSTRSLAREIGVSHSTVRRIWKAHGLRPNASRVSRLAQGSPYARRSADLIGVYVNPPQRAAAIALGGPPGAAGGPARAATRPGSDHAPWMTELYSGLASLDRESPPRASRRHTQQEFLSFLRSVQLRRLGGERIVLLADASRPELSPPLAHWLSRHPRISAELCEGPDEWKEKVVASIRAAAGSHAAPDPPPGLPHFLSAVARWKRGDVSDPPGFAWTKD